MYFYEPDEAYGFLSNFYPAMIDIDGERWLSTEHYYHAQKFTDKSLQQKIRAALTPREAFSLSREYQSFVRADWEAIRCDIMYFAVMEKFLQHDDLCQQLMATHPALLIENSPCDMFWGSGKNRHGQNKLGMILMSVRTKVAAKYRHV
ncbi:NADAR family protein [Grimontia hollisae]|nr:NADAR family protein [Grimontia hollisae]